MKYINMMFNKKIIIGLVVIFIQFIAILNLIKENNELNEKIIIKEISFSQLFAIHRTSLKYKVNDFSEVKQFDKYKEYARLYTLLTFIEMSYDYSRVDDTGASTDRYFLRKLHNEKIIDDDDFNDPFKLRNSFPEIKDHITSRYHINPLVTKDLASYNEFTEWVRNEINKENDDDDSSFEIERNIFDKFYNMFLMLFGLYP